MRVVINRDREMKGVTYACAIDKADAFEKALNRERIAEIEVEPDDVIYVVMRAGNLKSDNEVISAVPDFIYDVSPVNTSKNWGIIKENIDSEREHNNVLVTAFVNINGRYVTGCNMFIAKCGESCIDFRTSIHLFDELVDYYERVIGGSLSGA